MPHRVTDEELQVYLAKTGHALAATIPTRTTRTNKFRAVQKEVDGHLFESGAEAKRYVYLRHLETLGEIADLICQPCFSFYYADHHIFDYFADFAYLQDGKRVVEDVKGVKTEVYQLKRKLIELRYQMTIVEIKRKK